MDRKNSNILLLISFGGLMLASLLLFMGSGNSTTPINPTLFRLPDPTVVDRVLIENPDLKIDLSFKSGGWRVNDTLEADRNLVDVLFATVQQAVPKRRVAARIRDSVVNSINTSGIKVSFFSGTDTQKQFTVWGDASSGLTYFSDPGDRDPYVMVIPGYRVQVSGIFEQQLNTWRDKRIFNFNWRNFRELSARFPRDPKQNFTVAMTGRFFSILNETSIDTASLNNYLDAVSLINAERFYDRGESTAIDSLIKTTPIMSIRVKDVSDKTYSLNLFEIGQGQRNAVGQWGSDYVWFDRGSILPIYKKKKDFVK